MKTISDAYFDLERELYNSHDICLINCRFQGLNDGESPLKECCNVHLFNCDFDLRYPLWHDKNVRIESCQFSEKSRAALWYGSEIEIIKTKLFGVKAIRECQNVKIDDCQIISNEFAWKSEKIRINNASLSGEYCFFLSKKIEVNNFNLIGKYSFQYVEDAQFDNCQLKTKDAFWHCKNVIVRNSIIDGEYLGWYSTNLTLIDCKIIGTQPLCYCQKLKLIDCEMINCDLSFEKSDVNATITSRIISIKNPKSGHIKVKGIDKIINDTNFDETMIDVNND